MLDYGTVLERGKSGVLEMLYERLPADVILPCARLTADDTPAQVESALRHMAAESGFMVRSDSPYELLPGSAGIWDSEHVRSASDAYVAVQKLAQKAHADDSLPRRYLASLKAEIDAGNPRGMLPGAAMRMRIHPDKCVPGYVAQPYEPGEASFFAEHPNGGRDLSKGPNDGSPVIELLRNEYGVISPSIAYKLEAGARSLFQLSPFRRKEKADFLLPGTDPFVQISRRRFFTIGITPEEGVELPWVALTLHDINEGAKRPEGKYACFLDRWSEGCEFDYNIHAMVIEGDGSEPLGESVATGQPHAHVRVFERVPLVIVAKGSFHTVKDHQFFSVPSGTVTLKSDGSASSFFIQ